MKRTKDGNRRIAAGALALAGASLAASVHAADPASWATMETNPNESCRMADTGSEEKRCTVKRICIANQSGAVLKVFISAIGRTADNEVQSVPVGQEACRGIYVFNQKSAAIGILKVQAVNAQFTDVVISTRAGNQYQLMDYGARTNSVTGKWQLTGNWPGGGNTYSKPSYEDSAKGTWKFTVYGRVLPAVNFCGSNNSSESSTVAVKECAWSTS